MKRLRSMTNEFIPKEVQNSKIEFSCQPGESFYQYKNEYDFVLADVPCSGERHVVENKKRLNEWKFKQSKYLQKRQFGILCAAVDAVKSEGQVTYSTCSMLDEENDHQIQKLIKRCKKKDIQIEVILENKKLGKCTEFGVQILPHLSAGAGPGYYASFKVMKS